MAILWDRNSSPSVSHVKEAESAARVGAKPADLPVQQPAKFEFIVNLKTAKLLGIKIPGTVLAQATKVIE